MTIEIVSFPMNIMVIFHSYVKQPEGMWKSINIWKTVWISLDLVGLQRLSISYIHGFVGTSNEIPHVWNTRGHFDRKFNDKAANNWVCQFQSTPNWKYELHHELLYVNVETWVVKIPCIHSHPTILGGVNGVTQLELSPDIPFLNNGRSTFPMFFFLVRSPVKCLVALINGLV